LITGAISQKSWPDDRKVCLAASVSQEHVFPHLWHSSVHLELPLPAVTRACLPSPLTQLRTSGIASTGKVWINQISSPEHITAKDFHTSTSQEDISSLLIPKPFGSFFVSKPAWSI